jgi:hypothetical protein
MKIQKMPRNARLLISIGLLLATMPMLFREYIPLSDFFRGFLAGIGLVMEVAGLVVMKRWKNSLLS